MPSDEPKSYWKSLAERDGEPPDTADEFTAVPDGLTPTLSRRGFLRAAGFTFAGATLAGCSRVPEHQAVPYLTQPEEVVPGRSLYYASTCGACSAGCGLLLKDRDGRPIKLEGNPTHPLSHGGLCAVGQASILGLYDRLRLRQPRRDGRDCTWQEVDRELLGKLEEIRQQGGAVRFLSRTVTSPTIAAAIRSFLGRFANGRQVIYDPLSCSAILDAHQRTHRTRVLPHYRLDRAEIIVSFDADFLGTWIAPVEFGTGYRAGRSLDVETPQPSYHLQFESRLSLTGSKADQRQRVAPGEIGLILTHLAARLARQAGVFFDTAGLEASPVSAALLDHLAMLLWQSCGRSLVLCGSQDVSAQTLCNFVNHILMNYGATLDIEKPSYQRQGDDRQVAELLHELREGKVAALFLYGSNPLYDLPGSEELASALSHVPLVVSFAERLDETAARANFVCPDHHYLESWADAEPVAGVLTLTQPAIRPFGDTRAVLEGLAIWSGGKAKSAYEQIRARWTTQVFPRQNGVASFETFWDRAVHDGYVQIRPERVQVRSFDLRAVKPVLSASRPSEGTLEVVLYSKVAMPEGSHAYNPWLHELPDPISKVAWDNYACISPAAAERLRISEGDVVRLEADAGGRDVVLDLPAFIQPGQHDGVIAVALGYGNRASERFGKVGPHWLEARPTLGENGLVGVNAAPFVSWQDGTLRFTGTAAKITRTGKQHPLASTQSYHRLLVPKHLAPAGGESRPIVQEVTLGVLRRDRAEAREEAKPKHDDLWPEDHPTAGPRWGMAIDLNACTGCSACVVACQVENNIPVVGKDEVRRHREMHWLRVDRYYSGDGGDVEVVHQPMLCQHCGNAPCETVCPVLATVHSSDGLNQQVYNRCVGTRYCANNCPYKVRRFNWFNYVREDALQNLVLNPDVTVRGRGVMEKCTFCVQRIQEARLDASQRGEKVADGEIQTACQQSCPSQAIVFGDLNDPSSKVSRLMRSPRRFRVLEELNVRPVVGYLAVVRNQPIPQ